MSSIMMKPESLQSLSHKSTNRKTRKIFTNDEDALLISLMSASSPFKSWEKVASMIPNRTARQCRDRWFNYLSPSIRHDPWTDEEDRKLIELINNFGTHWSQIAKYFEGRSDNHVKNRWYSYLKGKVTTDPNGKFHLSLNAKIQNSSENNMCTSGSSICNNGKGVCKNRNSICKNGVGFVRNMSLCSHCLNSHHACPKPLQFSRMSFMSKLINNSQNGQQVNPNGTMNNATLMSNSNDMNCFALNNISKNKSNSNNYAAADFNNINLTNLSDGVSLNSVNESKQFTQNNDESNNENGEYQYEYDSEYECDCDCHNGNKKNDDVSGKTETQHIQNDENSNNHTNDMNNRISGETQVRVKEIQNSFNLVDLWDSQFGIGVDIK
ncbi:hypothetical protein TRFO_28895 [Tritrichomonas foetus]|uniref:Myb-like DNA-binding domain containing protein n=1 Tax=Tritrichomonas foetus TaxID=1144522 RepID=A0A1J4K1M7_9EUKA|nr:hypothetical protein TRFO_28895 [Tritrichomonas foetus]|eukprot:OHT03644.1 hypothetical protein TRFO_28895 [Tritrichomonas foetus]